MTRAIDDVELKHWLDGIVSRHPAVGLAAAVVHPDRLACFQGHGLADVASGTPLTENTVVRIASVTKLFTAVAVMQLWEQGLVDLDAPANAYLRGYQLVSRRTGFRPATVRHLLTHTAGIPDVIRIADLLHPDWGGFDARPASFSVAIGEQLPALGDYYRDGLKVVVEPGTVFAYSNHGFATLGQLVEDVSGLSLDRYLHERVFAPLGMASTTLHRSDLPPSRLATGYAVGPGGATAVLDREWITRGASGIYSTVRDMACFVTALAAGGSGEHGAMLRPATLAMMFEPHFQPDGRLPGMGLGFFRSQLGGLRVVGHDGRLPGFNAELLVAPDRGVGLFAVTNGAAGALAWLPIESEQLLRQVLALPAETVGASPPHRPEVWADLIGRYQLPARVSDLRGRLAMGAGAEVVVRGGQLMLRLLTPVPALLRGLPLVPDDSADPDAFRLDLSTFGLPVVRVVFSRDEATRVQAMHTDLGMMSFVRQPQPGPRTRLAKRIVAVATAGTLLAVLRRRRENAT